MPNYVRRSILCGIVGGGFLLLGCDGQLLPAFEQLFGIGAGGPSSVTVLSSTSLNDADEAARAAAVTDREDGLCITPDNVNGKVLSVLFAMDGMEDGGVTVFGNQRPDIAPTGSELYDFDLAERLPIESTLSLPPNFRGGQSSIVVMLFGYIDVEFMLDGEARTVRVAFADTGPMRRGDVLLELSDDDYPNPDKYPVSDDDYPNPDKHPVSDDDPRGPACGTAGDSASFCWYDTEAEEFVARRPNNPAAIAAIRDFVDPIRPQMAFYCLNAFMDDPVVFDADELDNAAGARFDIDFEFGGAIILENQHDEAIDDATLITSFNLAQIATNHAESGLSATASLEVISIEPNPTPIGIEPNPTP